MAKVKDLQRLLKPFHQRASDAEDRLARIEDAFAKNNDSGNKELLKKIGQVELEDAKAEREKALKQAHQLSVESAKL